MPQETVATQGTKMDCKYHSQRDEEQWGHESAQETLKGAREDAIVSDSFSR